MYTPSSFFVLNDGAKKFGGTGRFARAAQAGFGQDGGRLLAQVLTRRRLASLQSTRSFPLWAKHPELKDIEMPDFKGFVISIDFKYRFLYRFQRLEY